MTLKEKRELMWEYSEDLSEGQLLDIIIECITDEKIYDKIIEELRIGYIIDKLTELFADMNRNNNKRVRVFKKEKPNEYLVSLSDKDIIIEVVSIEEAIKNELNLISSIEEKNKFLFEIAKNRTNSQIGAYTILNDDLCYKELSNIIDK